MTASVLKYAALVSTSLALAGCATGTGTSTGTSASGASNPPYVSLDEARPTLPQSSAECLAQKLKSSDPFPASAIPAAALSQRQSGWVAMRYDVIAGTAQNIAVVASRPAGVYDAAALQHAARYRDPTRSTVRGCIMTIEVKF
jgi:outer membrane biosynthesis protein TonB